MSETQEEKVYDIYAPLLNFKKALEQLNRVGVSFQYIPKEHRRRLKAYELLEAFYYNYSRDYRFSPDSGGTSQNDTIFEAGDAQWICDTIKSKLFGDKIDIAIEMPDEIKEIGTLRDSGKEPERLAELEALRSGLVQREAYLRRWWKNNNVRIDIDKNEQKCSYLGDCAYLVEWVKEKIEGEWISRPNIKTYDPGFVFPFFNCNDKSLDGDALVKDRVILAWEETSRAILDNVGEDQFFVIYREIYELRVDKNGDQKCFRKSGYYKYNGSENVDLLNLIDDNLLDESGAKWEDLGIDFMPVLIVPNIEVEGHDFGLSNLHFLIGVIDAMINNDSDIRKNSELLGGASVFASGKDVRLAIDPVTKQPKAIAIQPNTFYPLGEGGSAVLLDTSSMQKALLDTHGVIEKKLLRNSKITEIGAGKVEVSQLSTISIKLLMQPLLDKINPMRDQRNRRYSTMFYYVQRLFQLKGTTEEKSIFASPLYDFTVKWGAILPGDEKAKLEEYAAFNALTDDQTTLERMKDDGEPVDVQKVLGRKKAQKAEQVAANADLFGLRAGAENNQGGQ
jgi:hypothetical protein